MPEFNFCIIRPKKKKSPKVSNTGFHVFFIFISIMALFLLLLHKSQLCGMSKKCLFFEQLFTSKKWISPASSQIGLLQTSQTLSSNSLLVESILYTKSELSHIHKMFKSKFVGTLEDALTRPWTILSRNVYFPIPVFGLYNGM